MTPLQRAERAAHQIAGSLTTPVLVHLDPYGRVLLASMVDTKVANDGETSTWNRLSTGERSTLLIAWRILQVGRLRGGLDDRLRGVVTDALTSLGHDEVTG